MQCITFTSFSGTALNSLVAYRSPGAGVNFFLQVSQGGCRIFWYLAYTHIRDSRPA